MSLFCTCSYFFQAFLLLLFSFDITSLSPKTGFWLVWLNFTIAASVPNLFFFFLTLSSFLSKYAFVILLWGERHSDSFVSQFLPLSLASPSFVLFLFLILFPSIFFLILNASIYLFQMINKHKTTLTSVKSPTPSHMVRFLSVCWRSARTSLPSPGTQSLNSVNGRP